MESQEEYAVLIVDIVVSRGYPLESRTAIQWLLAESIGRANCLFRDALVKRLMFCGGDEAQGLFYDPVSAFLAYRFLALALGRVPLRAGLACGRWTVRLPVTDSTAQDGEVFYRARDALNEARASRKAVVVNGLASQGIEEVLSRWSTEMEDVLECFGEEAIQVECENPLLGEGVFRGPAPTRSKCYKLTEPACDKRRGELEAFLELRRRLLGRVETGGDVAAGPAGRAACGDPLSCERLLATSLLSKLDDRWEGLP